MTALERRLDAAVRGGEVATLQQLHEQHPLLIEEYSSQPLRNVLHTAIMHRQTALVEKVLELTPRLTRTTNSNKSSPLHIAAAEGLVEICQKLLSEAPDTCWWKDHDYMTPLHIAAREGHVHICQKLLSEAPDTCWWKDCDDMTPLHIAAREGHVEICQKLLSEADPGVCWIKDRKGMNALYIACMKGHVEIVELLLQEFPLLATSSLPHKETLLHLCMKHSQFDMLKVLVEKLGEENLDATDENGETVMSLAIKLDQVEIIKYLVDSEKIKSLTRNSMGKTELQILDQMPRGGTTRYVDIKTILSQLLPPSTDDVLPEWTDMTKAMAVAALTISVAYQNCVYPPSSVWQEDSPIHKAGEAVLAYTHPKIYKTLVLTNSAAFASALFTIFLVTVGWPSKNKYLLRTALAAMWVSLITLVGSYAASTSSL